MIMAIELGGKQYPEVELLPGETVNHVFQGDGFFLGVNPIAKMIAVFQRFITKITGGHIRVFLLLTNVRVLMIQSTAQFCGLNSSRGATAIASSSIKEAGVARVTMYCCIHTRTVHIQSLTQNYTLVVKKFTDPDLQNFLKHLSDHIIANTRNV
jgi:hypothetical protein